MFNQLNNKATYIEKESQQHEITYPANRVYFSRISHGDGDCQRPPLFLLSMRHAQTPNLIPSLRSEIFSCRALNN